MPGKTGATTSPSQADHRRPRRVQPAEVRLDELMSAAAELFVARGIEATTVDHIVARAGVAKGTFYHYFSTKADVIRALRERFTQDFLSRVAAAIDTCPTDDHPGRLSAWVNGAVATYLANFQLHDVVFHDFPHSRRQSQEKDAVITQLATLLEAGRAAHAWIFPDSRAVALILFDGMHGVVDDAIVAGEHAPEPLCRLLTDLFSRRLAA